MKSLLALVAIVLCLLVAYRMHRDRLENVKKLAEAEALVKRISLSEHIEPYRKELSAPLDERRPADLVPTLQAVRAKVVAIQQAADPDKRPITDAGIVALDRMITVAEHRTEALRELLNIGSRPTSSLERKDSSNTAGSFFKSGALRRAEEGKAQRQAAIEQAIRHLREVESQVVAAHGPAAALEEYGWARSPRHYVKTGTDNAIGNPLNQGAYDQRRAMQSRRDAAQDSGF